jgi:recombinational DNA repair protein (RecF pathway)
MQTKVEGIILSKTPYQERHLICRLLLRSGEKISAIFYGGQGGGKKKKSSLLEVGHLIKVEITRSKKTAQIFSIKEWSLVWHHDLIRNNHKAFYMLCFFLELSDKLVVEADLFEGTYEQNKNSDTIFKVLSNAIFHLERRLKFDEVLLENDLFTFIAKILIQEGIFPERTNCVLSGEVLNNIHEVVLLDEQGGFADSSCVNIDMRDPRLSGEQAKELWSLLCFVATMKYGEVDSLSVVSKNYSMRILDYLLYQLSWRKDEFKTVSLLF